MVTAILYLIVYFGGLIKAMMGKPVWGLYIYFFSFYFHAPTMWWGQALPNLRWSLIAAIITMVTLFIYPPKRGLRFFHYRENRFLAAFAFLVIAQLTWVRAPAFHMEYVILIVKFIILIFLIQNILVSAKEIKGFVWANVFGCAYFAYYAMSMHNGGRMENYGVGSGWDSNLAGQHFAAMIILGGYLLLEKLNKTHAFVAAGIGVIMMGLFMTESRSAIIAVGGTGVIATFFVPQGKRKKLAMFGVLAIVAGASLMGPQIVERFQGMQKDELGEVEDKSAESRFVIIRAQIEMWKASPIIGHGHRGTLILSPNYIDEEYQTGGVRASHNVLMAFLVDHGLIGTILYFGAIFSCWLRLLGYKYETKPEEQTEYQKLLSTMLVGASLALLAFMLCGMGSNNKKLEADIWLIAFIPLLSQEIRRIKNGGNPSDPDDNKNDSLSDDLPLNHIEEDIPDAPKINIPIRM
ncbi:MAG: hypothetical protein CL840_05180 [Crocinitomicaceae bacterium]|nr:hypothetical protein [Crocinitomicaceae bacterium]|tara:strand:- start:19298 stop:20689 length:1392 start_codon:yes stop_codon:yes gene_type:complete